MTKIDTSEIALEVPQKDILRAHKFKSIYQFRTVKKKTSPYTLFQEEAVKGLSLDPKNDGYTISNIVVHVEDAEKLNEYMLNWLKKTQKFLSPHQLNLTYAMYHLDMSPVAADGPHIKKNHIYLRRT